MHAKCNDKDVPRNSRSPKNGKPSHSVVVRIKSDKRKSYGDNKESDEAADQSEDE